MDTYTLVRPEHCNHYGHLFGGQLLKWVDEFAWLAASRDFPGSRLVTRAMDKVEFKIQVSGGSILRFTVGQVKKGTTSVTYEVKVFGQQPDQVLEKEVFFTIITFVCVNEKGEKSVLP